MAPVSSPSRPPSHALGRGGVKRFANRRAHLWPPGEPSTSADVTLTSEPRPELSAELVQLSSAQLALGAEAELRAAGYNCPAAAAAVAVAGARADPTLLMGAIQ